MDKRLLVVLVTTLMMLTPASALFFSDFSEGDDPPSDYDTTGKITDDKEITFTGKVKFYDVPEKNEEPNMIVLIATKIVSASYERLTYVVEPQKVKINSDGTFSVPSYRITTQGLLSGLNYYFLLESGYEIYTTSSSLDDTLVDVYRYNSPSLIDYSEMYSAFELDMTVDATDETVPITSGDYDVIGAVRVTGTFTAIATYDDYKLSNVEIRLLREGVTDPDDYSYSGMTENDGICTIYGVSTGGYTIVAFLENYKQSGTPQVLIQKDAVANVDIEMEIGHMEDTYWGYDLPHFLMICGGGIGLIVIATSIILQYRTIKGKGQDWFYNDVKDEESEEKEE